MANKSMQHIEVTDEIWGLTTGREVDVLVETNEIGFGYQACCFHSIQNISDCRTNPRVLS